MVIPTLMGIYKNRLCNAKAPKLKSYQLHCTDRLVVILVHGDSEEVVEIVLQLLLPGVHLVRLQHRVRPLGEPRQGRAPAPTAARGQLPLSFLLGLKFKSQGQMELERSRNFGKLIKYKHLYRRNQ